MKGERTVKNDAAKMAKDDRGRSGSPRMAMAMRMQAMAQLSMRVSSALWKASGTVRAMIRRQKETYGWEFIFLGANIDAVETAANFGIDRQNAVDYRADGRGTLQELSSVHFQPPTLNFKTLPPAWAGRLVLPTRTPG